MSAFQYLVLYIIPCSALPRHWDKDMVQAGRCCLLDAINLCAYSTNSTREACYLKQASSNIHHCASSHMLQPRSPNSDIERRMKDIDEVTASNALNAPASSSGNDGAKPSVSIQLEDNPTATRAKIYHTGWRLYALTAR